MLYTLNNDKLKVNIDSCGGELMSIIGPDGKEYLWQGDERYWKKRAPHLFPVVGRLTNGECTLEGVSCKMDTHGFFRWREMQAINVKSDCITFRMESDVETLSQYPRSFEVLLTYQLIDFGIKVSFAVKNKDKNTMWFGYGGHPGFRVPLKNGLSFEDYYLEFENPDPIMVGMSKNCFVEGPDIPFKLDGKILRLNHSLFDNDAIILKNSGNRVKLSADNDSGSVTVEFAGMPYVGLWHAPQTDAPYICIEPWASLPARQNVVEELSGNPNMIRLDSDCQKEFTWTVVIR